MDSRHVSIAVLFGCGLCVVGGFVLVLNRSAEQASWEARNAALQAQVKAMKAVRRFPSVVQRGQSDKSNADAAGRFERLQTLLRDKTAEIRRKNAEYREVQTKLNETLKLVQKLLSEERSKQAAIKTANVGKPPSSAKSPAAANGTVDVEREVGILLDRERQAELQRLRGELQQANLELAGILEEAENELVALAASADLLQNSAADVLVRTGAAAVPALVDVLGDSRPRVRRWAATMLGRMGRNARLAGPALTTAVDDSDASVRTAARAALNAIEATTPN